MATEQADTPATGGGIKTGAGFLDRLRDGREVWYRGSKIADVTAFPAFRGVCGTLAGLYDLQFAHATRDDMTYADEAGRRVSASFLVPDTPERLAHRKRNHRVWGRETFGLMGRNPDFCGGILMGLYELRDQLGALDPAFRANVLAYIDHARAHDICLTHGLHDPNMDKTLSISEDPDRCLRIVGQTDAGYVVRGARYATLAPFADEIICYPSAMLGERDDAHAIWFAVPMNTPGIRTVCRDSYAAGRDAENHPMSVRFDEQDGTVLFDDVLVPFDRVFLAKNAAEATRLYRGGLMTWAAFAAAQHLMERYTLFIGLAHLIAKTAGVAGRPKVQEEIGELVTLVEMLRLAHEATELQAERTPGGLFAPKRSSAARAFAILISERMNSLIERVGTGALVFNCTLEDLEAPELAPLLALYGRGHGVDARTRQKLVRAGFELASDSFGSRQQLYERLHSGDPWVWIANVYRQYDKSEAVAAVNRLLGTELEP